jgi:hypothetical protein
MEEAKAEVAGEEVLMKEETERKAEGGVVSDALRLRENIVAIFALDSRKTACFWRGSASHGRGAE